MSKPFKLKSGNCPPYKMMGSSPYKQDWTGGSDENVVHGGQVSAWNPQYVPGHQVKKEKKEEITSYKNPRYL